jgi:hypothetical protein
MVEHLRREALRLDYTTGLPSTFVAAPAINAGNYGIAVYTVDSRIVPHQRVQLIDYTGDKVVPALESMFMDVPIPLEVQAAPPTPQTALQGDGHWDGHCVILDTFTRQGWGFWKFRSWYPDGTEVLPNGSVPARHWFLDAVFPDGSTGGQGKYSAQWGEYMPDYTTHPGWYSGSTQKYWGSRACSASVAGGLMTPNDVQGEIEHALAFAIRYGSRRIRRPAQRTDGPKVPTADDTPVPQGQRFWLDPSIDSNDPKYTRYPILPKMIRAAQRHGIVNVDTSGNLTFYAQWNVPAGFSWKTDYLAGAFSGDVVKAFPWSGLTAVKRDNEPLCDALGNVLAEGA